MYRQRSKQEGSPNKHTKLGTRQTGKPKAGRESKNQDTSNQRNAQNCSYTYNTSHGKAE